MTSFLGQVRSKIISTEYGVNAVTLAALCPFISAFVKMVKYGNIISVEEINKEIEIESKEDLLLNSNKIIELVRSKEKKILAVHMLFELIQLVEGVFLFVFGHPYLGLIFFFSAVKDLAQTVDYFFENRNIMDVLQMEQLVKDLKYLLS